MMPFLYGQPSMAVLVLLATTTATTLVGAFAGSAEAAFCADQSRRHRRTALQQQLDKGFNLLEVASGVFPQGKIVQTAKEGWKFAWQRMMAELAPQDKQGNYQRPSYGFGGKIGDANFPDEPNRYQLYVGNPCPWCHRTVLAARILGLEEDDLGLTRLEDNPVKASRGGWIFNSARPDPVFASRDLRELYDKLSPGGFRGRCTAPLLVDKKSKRIVSNESADIVRMLNRANFGQTEQRIDLVPAELETKIDETNEWVYRLVSNGVYRCGFSTTQSAYDRAAAGVCEGLERCEQRLQDSPYLCGSAFTEADLRLLPTMLRFDGAYAPLFKAGGAHLNLQASYPSIHKWLKRCWQEYPAVRESIDISDACASYYRQLFPLNPGGIIPTPVTAKDLGLE